MTFPEFAITAMSAASLVVSIRTWQLLTWHVDQSRKAAKKFLDVMKEETQ